MLTPPYKLALKLPLRPTDPSLPLYTTRCSVGRGLFCTRSVSVQYRHFRFGLHSNALHACCTGPKAQAPQF